MFVSCRQAIRVAGQDGRRNDHFVSKAVRLVKPLPDVAADMTTVIMSQGSEHHVFVAGRRVHGALCIISIASPGTFLAYPSILLAYSGIAMTKLFFLRTKKSTTSITMTNGNNRATGELVEWGISILPCSFKIDDAVGSGSATASGVSTSAYIVSRLRVPRKPVSSLSQSRALNQIS